MSEREHRRAPRITQSFMARYRALSGGQGTWAVSPLRDFSSGGARFVCEDAFPVGTVLELQLVLPSSKAPVPLQAQVTWVKPGLLNLTELGVAFSPVEADIQQLIDTAVVHFVRKQRIG